MYPFKQDDLSQLIYIRLVKCEIATTTLWLDKDAAFWWFHIMYFLFCSMNTIPQAMKSQVNPAGKISLNTGSISQGGASTFSIKQLPQKVGNIGGTSSANTSTTGTSGQPAAFIKIKKRYDWT